MGFGTPTRDMTDPASILHIALVPVSATLDPEAAHAAVDVALSGGPNWFISIATILLSLVTSFVFAGSETAITGLGELRIRKLLDSHKGPRGLLELWLSDPSRLLTTLLAGNTLANITSSALVTSLALRLAQNANLDASWTELVVVAILTFIVLVFSEIAPKTLANNHPERFLPALHFVWWFHVATRWITQLATWVAMGLVRAMGGSSKPTTFQVTEEQIEDMVRIGSESGMLDTEQGDLLQGVFLLSELQVRQIMTPRTKVDGLPIDAEFEQIAQFLISTKYSRFPVYSKTMDKIVGVFYAKDLVDHMLRGDVKNFRLADHLREPRFVPESKKAGDLLRDFQKESVHMAVVVDEHGGTAGIVTLEDVLEQLVGEIYDEYDQPEPLIRPTGDGTWSVDATAEVRDFADEIGLDLPDLLGYSTVGGYVTEQMGHVPRLGETLRVDGLMITVREADDNRVVRVDVERLASPEPPTTDDNQPQPTKKRISGVTPIEPVEH